MTPSEVAELKRLAEAATPGPWYLRTNRHTATNGNKWGWLDSYPPGGKQEKPDGVTVAWEEGCKSHSNALYIAAANPSTIRALIAENEAKDAEIERLREVLKPFSEAAEDLDEDEKGHIWERPSAMSIDADDLRRARQALTGKEEK